MAAYKDEARGTWYVSFHYNDWTGKNKRKLKRGFRTRKEALEYEQKFLLQQATNLDMRFEDFYKLYEEDLKPKVYIFCNLAIFKIAKPDTLQCCDVNFYALKFQYQLLLQRSAFILSSFFAVSSVLFDIPSCAASSIILSLIHISEPTRPY